MTGDRRRTSAPFDTRAAAPEGCTEVRRSKRVRMAAGSLLMVGVIATGICVVGAGAEASPPQSAVHWAGPNDVYGTASSLNWAGYAVTGAVFTKVAGSWTQPQAHCTKTGAQLAAFWVGIDGFSSTDPTVEQVGTDSDCKKGAASYYAWYQMYPKAAVVLPKAKYPVVAGETIAAHVSGAAKTFTLEISATSSGGALKWHFSTALKVTKVPLESSAEWITEAPCTGASTCTVDPLSNFGVVKFSGASANGRPISAPAFNATQLTMTNGASIVKAHPSNLAAAGTAFTVTWLHS